MFGNNRKQLRQVFFDSWQLKKTGQAPDAMQKVILTIIESHPEYHHLFENKASLEKDFSIESGENNPFLHISMHIALHEQLSINRPAGINTLYQKLCQQQASAHKAEHKMMDCLGKSIWQAQRNQTAPDEDAYIRCLQTLIHKK